MLIGDKRLFAIESEKRCVIDGKKHLHFRFWSNDQPIGEYDDDVMDSIVVGYMKEFRANEKSRLSQKQPQTYNIEDLYNIIYASFYGEHSDKYSQEIDKFGEGFDFRANYHLNDIGGTCFDGLILFACELDSDQQIFIWGRDAKSLSATLLPSGFIETQFELFLKSEEL